MKRTLLLSLALTLFTCAYAAVGDTFVLDNVTYIVKSDNTVGIKKADSKVTSFNLTDQVTNEGTTYTVVSVEDYAFQYSEATALTLPSTITSIGYSAFSSCKAASIILPKNSRLSATTHSTQCATSPLLRFLKAWRLSAPTSIQAHSALAML